MPCDTALQESYTTFWKEDIEAIFSAQLSRPNMSQVWKHAFALTRSAYPKGAAELWDCGRDRSYTHGAAVEPAAREVGEAVLGRRLVEQRVAPPGHWVVSGQVADLIV